MQISNYESNARFAKKSLKLDYSTLNALVKFYENGGTITKVEAAARPKKGYTTGKIKVVK